MTVHNQRLKILAINGSASKNSSNQKLIDNFVRMSSDGFDVTVFDELKALPHFDPQATDDDTPSNIAEIRSKIDQADGVLICTPEYVFSIPSGLKNLLEWCVSTTVFLNKPTALITASLDGTKGHEELQLIMKTVMCNFKPDTTLLVNGVKGKVSATAEITDKDTQQGLQKLVEAFEGLIRKSV